MIKFLNTLGAVLALIAFSLTVLTVTIKSDERPIMPQCEVAIIESARIAMIFVETGQGYKAMIIADNAARQICGAVSS